ncbi:uncharacterized [Tachysurus ichikawai]
MPANSSELGVSTPVMLSFSLIKEKREKNNGLELDLIWSWLVLLSTPSLFTLVGIRSSATLDVRSGAPGLWGWWWWGGRINRKRMSLSHTASFTAARTSSRFVLSHPQGSVTQKTSHRDIRKKNKPSARLSGPRLRDQG